MQRLSIATQVAAAVGMRLPLDLLAAVHPLVDTPAALQGDLRSLAAAQFLRLNAEDGSWAWTQVCPPAGTVTQLGMCTMQKPQQAARARHSNLVVTLMRPVQCCKCRRRHWREK